MSKSLNGADCPPSKIAGNTCEGKMTKAPETNTNPAADQSETDRSRRIRQWIDRKMGRWAGRGLAGGLGSSLLALPAFAQATIEELYAYQFAETIPGVQSAKLLKNGDVLLKMTDGRSMIVAAENIQVLDSGAIMIAEAAVAEIAQFSLAEAGAAAAGGVSGAGAALGGLGLAGAAAAAGGGGGGDDASPAPTPTPPPAPSHPSLNLAQLQGTTLSSSTINSVAPAGTDSVEITIGSVVKTVTPDSDGNWSVSLTPSEASGVTQGVTDITIRHLDDIGDELSVETVTFDIDTVPPTLAITSFSDGAVMNTAEQATDLTVSGTTDAENGQTVTVSLNGQTYTGTVSGGNWSVTVPAADLASLPDSTTISVTADVSDEAGNPAPQTSSGFDTDFSAPTISLDPVAGGSIELIDVSGDLTLTGSTSAEDGQTVTVTMDGQTYSGTASGGSWSVTVPNADLSGLTTGTPMAVSVTVEDAAGNPAVAAMASVPVDLTGPSISIAPLTIGSVLNAAEAGSDLTISGTTGNVQDGQTVTVTLDGQTYTGTVSGGSWSVTVPAGDLAALADGGSFSITADVSDVDGLAAPQADTPITKDASAPTLSIDSFSDGAVMNAAEQATDLTITGATSAEDGQVVTVELNGQTYTGTASGGGWSVTVPAGDLAALSDASTISVTADVSDAAGNPAIQVTNSFVTDFTAPSVAITNLLDGAVMNAAEQGTDLTISGTSDAPDGTVVTVEIARPDGTVDVTGTATVSGGNWTLTAPSSDLSGLQPDITYDVTASVTDSAGNRGQANTSFDTDFSAPSITIYALPVGAVLDVTERDSDLAISGTTTAGDGQTVSVTFGGQTYVATASGGTWTVTVPTSDLAALSDMTSYPISATVPDSAGNISPAATTSVTTDFRPTLSMRAIGTNEAIALSDAQSSGVVVSGSSAGLSTGQAVDVLLNGNSVGTATVGPDGTWSLTVSASEFAGAEAGDDLDFTAQATVSGGPDPLPVTTETAAYVPAAYVISEIAQSGSTITLAIHADSDRDISSGLAMTAELEYDSSVVTFDVNSDTENGEFDLFLANTGPGDVVSFAGAATTFTDLSQPLVTFTMTVQDPNQPIVLTIKTPDGGPMVLHLGTDGDDTLTASDVDTLVRGGEGDDTIDLNTAGRDVIVFEADSTINGVDTITGFTLGPETDVTDALMFSGLDVSTLRGDGTGFETLAVGDALGLDTGFVGLTTVLTDLTAASLETAVESLTGAQSGDALYLLATDGTDSALIRVDYSGSSDASVETLAIFDGLDDLGALSTDNILHTDPTGATA